MVKDVNDNERENQLLLFNGLLLQKKPARDLLYALSHRKDRNGALADWKKQTMDSQRRFDPTTQAPRSSAQTI